MDKRIYSITKKNKKQGRYDNLENVKKFEKHKCRQAVTVLHAGREFKMLEKILDNNQAVVAGEIIAELAFSHEVFGERFFTAKLRVDRLSESCDIVPLMISERLIDLDRFCIGQLIEAKGQFRSYNRHENNKNRLMLSLFVRELEFIDDLTGRDPM